MNCSLPSFRIPRGRASSTCAWASLPTARWTRARRSSSSNSERETTLLRILGALAAAWLGHAAAQPAPIADHHQHVFSPTAAPLLSVPSVTAKDVIGHLDA